jgi:Acyltransferase C-terminus
VKLLIYRHTSRLTVSYLLLGFITCVPILKKSKNLSVLNLQLAFDKDSKVKPTLVNILRGEKVVAHVYIDRIDIDNVEGTSEYLQSIYQEKDAIQDSFLTYGNFFEGRKEKAIEGIRMKPRLCVLVNTAFWFFINILLGTYYATKMILAGRFVFLLSISGGVIALCEYP